MSQWNKHGSGVAEYRGKRQALMAHDVHVVELDLLRRGRWTELARPLPPADYGALVFRAGRRPDVEVRTWGLRDPLPTVPVPLRRPDPDVPLDLAAVIASVYDCGRYDRKRGTTCRCRDRSRRPTRRGRRACCARREGRSPAGGTRAAAAALPNARVVGMMPVVVTIPAHPSPGERS